MLGQVSKGSRLGGDFCGEEALKTRGRRISLETASASRHSTRTWKGTPTATIGWVRLGAAVEISISLEASYGASDEVGNLHTTPVRTAVEVVNARWRFELGRLTVILTVRVALFSAGRRVAFRKHEIILVAIVAAPGQLHIVVAYSSDSSTAGGFCVEDEGVGVRDGPNIRDGKCKESFGNVG